MLTLGEGEGRPLSKGLGGTVSASPNANGSADPDNRRRFAMTLHNALTLKAKEEVRWDDYLIDSSVSSETPRRLGDRRKRLFNV